MTDRAIRFTPAWRTFVVIGVLAVAATTFVYVPARTETTVRTVSDGQALPEGAVELADGTGGGDVTRRVLVGGSHGDLDTDAGAGAAGDPGSGPGSGPVTGPGATVPGGGRIPRGPGVDPGPFECAPGKNGGATDVGVTANMIKLGATIVGPGSGTASDFLADARFGIQAVKDKINRAGGICGRRLEVSMIDDGWSASRGSDFIRNLVEVEKVFALAVVPSSEGLNKVSEAGYLKAKGVPVVGSDGMLKSQYKDPYIWPVAASTVSTMHIIADYAVKQRGKSTFGLVYDNQYKFGQEGATAFKNSLRRLGKEIGDDCSSRFCGIEAAAKGGYGGQINAFNTSCSQCDYIVFLLQPPTALAWINQGGKVLSGGNMAGPQPLFTRKFAEECKQACNGMWLWTGYIPAIDTNIGKTPIAQFRDDIKATSSSADVTNTFVEGAYIGMNLLKAALERLGPVVTRQGLIAVLNDTQGFDTGLTAKPMSWSRGDHFSNVTMQAYSIRYTDRFAGHLDERVSWDDPWVGSDL